jgi:hypothetical protein
MVASLAELAMPVDRVSSWLTEAIEQRPIWHRCPVKYGS